MDRHTIIAGLREEIDALNRAIEILEGGTGTHGAAPAKPAGKPGPKPGKRKLSAAARKKMADAQKKRWAKIKAAKAEKK